MKPLKSILAASLMAVALPLSSAHAEKVFFRAGSDVLPGTLNAGDSGTVSLTAAGLWLEDGASGDTRVEVILPEYVEANGEASPKVWPVMYTYSRSNAYVNQNGQALLRGLDGSSVPIETSVDYICGVYGFDVDPTDGVPYALMGRVNWKPTSDCSTGSRWLTKYNPSTGKFEWVGQLSYFNGLEFMTDGTLLGLGGSGVGRNRIYTVNKSTGVATFRVDPSSGNEYVDLVYNPGDDMLYSIDNCYIHRINTTNWTSTTSGSISSLCNLRYTAVALLSDNHFLVRTRSNLSELVIDPADGSFVSFTPKYAGNGDWPRAPMIAASLDAATVSKSCLSSGTGAVNCSFGSIPKNATVVVALPLKYSVPATARPGTRTGVVRWYRGATLLATQSLNLNVLSPDVAVTMTPASNTYQVNDTDTLSIDIEAVGGKDVNNVSVEVKIPSDVLTVTSIGSSGTCGLSRDGVLCTGINISAGGTSTVNIGFRAETDGLASVSAVAKVEGGDVDPSNDNAASTFVVGNSADLEATGTAGGTGKIGTALDLQVKVASRGPDAGVNSVLVLPGDAGFDLGTATTDVGTCAASGGDIRCAFGSMAVNTTATVNVKVTPNRPGNLTLLAKASSDVLDALPANNTHAFAVSVPTSPFTIALGQASPSSSRGDVRSVLQLAVTPAAGGPGVEISSLTGSLTLKIDGLELKRKLLVFEDRDANGVYDETDTFVGSGSLNADDNGFTVEFAKPISAPAKTTSNYILAVQTEGAPRVAGVPFGGSSSLWTGLAAAGMLALAFAGFAFGRRRAVVAAVSLFAFTLVGACSTVEDLLDNAKVAATITAVKANLQGDTGSPVDATGLPITGPTVTLSR